MIYKGLICGGLGDNTWDKEIEVEANNFKEAVNKIHLPYQSDIVEMMEKEIWEENYKPERRE